MGTIYVNIKIPIDEARILKDQVTKEIWRNSSDMKGVKLSYFYIIRRMRRLYLKNTSYEVDS
jgi:hypothetical protein